AIGLRARALGVRPARVREREERLGRLEADPRLVTKAEHPRVRPATQEVLVALSVSDRDLDLVALELGNPLDRDSPADELLERLETPPLLLGEEGGDLGMDAERDARRVAGRGDLALHAPEGVVGEGRDGADAAPAPAVRAGAGEELLQALARALAGHLYEAELGDAEHVRACLVPADRVLER